MYVILDIFYKFKYELVLNGVEMVLLLVNCKFLMNGDMLYVYFVVLVD